MSTIASAMIGILIEELVVLQLIHILLSFEAILIYIQFVGVETCTTSAELAMLGWSGVFVERWHLGESKYARDVDKFVWSDVFILINNQFEVNAVIIQESGDFHQHKVGVPSPVAKKVGIHKPYFDFLIPH
jgi:hypothetical protein